jgi:RimJ/RimL family protein N-acetyltransferase
MLDSLTLPPLPTLYGERVILRGPRDLDVDDRLRHPIDPEEEDGYGSSWRREWDGRRYHTREYLTATSSPSDPRTYTWKVDYDGHCIGSAGLEVNPQQHYAEYTVGLFVAALRGRGLGREVTRLVLVRRPPLSGHLDLWLFYAAAVISRYSSMTSCGVLYPSAE